MHELYGRTDKPRHRPKCPTRWSKSFKHCTSFTLSTRLLMTGGRQTNGSPSSDSHLKPGRCRLHGPLSLHRDLGLGFMTCNFFCVCFTDLCGCHPSSQCIGGRHCFCSTGHSAQGSPACLLLRCRCPIFFCHVSSAISWLQNDLQCKNPCAHHTGAETVQHTGP